MLPVVLANPTGKHGRQTPGSDRKAGRENILLGRAESVGDAYRARFQAHGETIARTASQLGWTATVHRTDHSPLKALLALHAAIGES